MSRQEVWWMPLPPVPVWEPDNTSAGSRSHGISAATQSKGCKVPHETTNHHSVMLKLPVHPGTSRSSYDHNSYRHKEGKDITAKASLNVSYLSHNTSLYINFTIPWCRRLSKLLSSVDFSLLFYDSRCNKGAYAPLLLKVWVISGVHGRKSLLQGFSILTVQGEVSPAWLNQVWCFISPL